jgi:putative glutamine amidotransferase
VTRPVVGIVGYHHAVPRPWGTLPVSGAPSSYVEAVASAGGRPVLLPQEHAPGQLDLVDAVVLTGGGDLDPRWYAGDPATAIDVDPARDESELAVARAAVAARLPLLAVCRGLQVLAVAFGGSLQTVTGHLLPGTGHAVETTPGSLVHGLLGARPHTSALHHQAVDHLGPGWRATAWADGVVEAVEPHDPAVPVLGVQWHPELSQEPFSDLTGPAVVGWLVSQAGRVRHDRPVLAGQR